ncbi:hypothetical protein NL108_005430 [Boleophthalmus pectinirostris]|nr:hypothetical protein NL108_005430 [Boleophthalmus pectinirostris]
MTLSNTTEEDKLFKCEESADSCGVMANEWAISPEYSRIQLVFRKYGAESGQKRSSKDWFPPEMAQMRWRGVYNRMLTVQRDNGAEFGMQEKKVFNKSLP